jgi:hypothetical protein
MADFSAEEMRQVIVQYFADMRVSIPANLQIPQQAEYSIKFARSSIFRIDPYVDEIYFHGKKFYVLNGRGEFLLPVLLFRMSGGVDARGEFKDFKSIQDFATRLPQIIPVFSPPGNVERLPKDTPDKRDLSALEMAQQTHANVKKLMEVAQQTKQEVETLRGVTQDLIAMFKTRESDKT